MRRARRRSWRAGRWRAASRPERSRHIASSSSGRPAPVAPEILKNGSPSAAARAATAVTHRRSSVNRVDLVGGDDLRLRRERRLKELQLATHRVEIVDRIAAARARDVDQVHEHLRALEVPQELMAEAQAAMRAFNQPGHVGDDEAAIVAQADDAEVRGQRGERVVRDLRTRGRDARDQRRLAGVREADEADVGEQLQLEPQIFDFARARPAALSAARGWWTSRTARCPCRRVRPWRRGRARLRRRGPRSADRDVPGRRSFRTRACRSAPRDRGRRRRGRCSSSPARGRRARRRTADETGS